MIQVNQLTFAYNRRAKLFNDLSLSMETGNVYGLLGKNGAGKTTLLRLMTGMLFPKTGNCLVNGKHPSARQPEVMQEIYVIPEEYELEPVQMATYAKVYAPFYPKFSAVDFKKYITEFELDPVQKLSKMSYGQKKKFLIAFGLATNASFMVLDEPTNGLDIPSKSQFRKLIASSVTNERCFIISTHQVRDLENLIDPVVIIDDGRIIFNQYIENIGKKLLFDNTADYDANYIVYSEGVEGRQRGVVLNQNGKSTQVDIELLFNAATQKKEHIETIFNS